MESDGCEYDVVIRCMFSWLLIFGWSFRLLSQVRGMISSALHTADGKVWRVVQKVIDRRETG